MPGRKQYTAHEHVIQHQAPQFLRELPHSGERGSIRGETELASRHWQKKVLWADQQSVAQHEGKRSPDEYTGEL